MTQQNDNASNVLPLDGEMTIFTAAAVREQLLQAMQDKSAIDVDLSAVSEFDTSGLQLMVAAKKMAEEKNIRLTFTQIPDVVTELLQLSRMTALAA